MATITSRVPAIIDYLVATFTAAATLGQATPQVTVFDGTPTTDLDPFLSLWVGATDPDNPNAEVAADFTQQWGAMGKLGRDETSTIHCVAQAWSGIDDIKTVRLAASAIMAAVEALMQAEATGFGGNVLFPDPGITQAALTQNNTNLGAIARWSFSLTFRSRIGG
jgi:hypothetical protein